MHKKAHYFQGLWLLAWPFLLIASGSLLCAEINVKEEAFFNKEFQSAVVPGKIVFQSNRDGALSEIWILENGQIKQVASGKKNDKNVSKQLSAPLAGMVGRVFSDLRKPKWSPDGEKILCSGNGKLMILSVNGKTLEQVKTAKYAHDAAWGPIGNVVYYSAIDRLPSGGGAYNIYKFR